MPEAADEVYRLAHALRELHRSGPEVVTFTHVPVVVDPPTALAFAGVSVLGRMLVEEGALLNTPTLDWYVPVEPVRAAVENLHGVGVTASTWEPPQRDYRAAELTVRFVYAEGQHKANQELRLYTRPSQPSNLSRWMYDHQRAETGYEGESPVFYEPSDEEVRDMLGLVRRLTGEPASSG